MPVDPDPEAGADGPDARPGDYSEYPLDPDPEDAHSPTAEDIERWDRAFFEVLAQVEGLHDLLPPPPHSEAAPHGRHVSAGGVDVEELARRVRALEEAVRELQPARPKRPPSLVPWGDSQNMLAAWIGLGYEAFMAQTKDPHRPAISKKRAVELIASVFEVHDKGDWRQPDPGDMYKKWTAERNPERVADEAEAVASAMRREVEGVRARSTRGR